MCRRYKRPVNMVFQNYALFPHLSVAQNVGFGPVCDTCRGLSVSGACKQR